MGSWRALFGFGAILYAAFCKENFCVMSYEKGLPK